MANLNELCSAVAALGGAESDYDDPCCRSFDFDPPLPSGMDGFPLWRIANHWSGYKETGWQARFAEMSGDAEEESIAFHSKDFADIFNKVHQRALVRVSFDCQTLGSRVRVTLAPEAETFSGERLEAFSQISILTAGQAVTFGDPREFVTKARAAAKRCGGLREMAAVQAGETLARGENSARPRKSELK